MFRKKVRLLFLCVGSLGLSACASITELALLEGGATRLSGEQVKAHLSGKTETWSFHDTYFAADGKVEALWEKVRYYGTWEVSADGKVCLNGRKLNNVCHSYVDDHGAITRIDEGMSSGVKKTVKGRQLSR